MHTFLPVCTQAIKLAPGYTGLIKLTLGESDGWTPAAGGLMQQEAQRGAQACRRALHVLVTESAWREQVTAVPLESPELQPFNVVDNLPPVMRRPISGVPSSRIQSGFHRGRSHGGTGNRSRQGGAHLDRASAAHVRAVIPTLGSRVTSKR